jgi:hypothetical protein
MFSTDLIQSASENLGVEPAAVQAVVEIESSGAPFLPEGSVTPMGFDVSGFPTVQFEGHVFWKYLTKLASPPFAPAGILADPERFNGPDGKPLRRELLDSVLYPKQSVIYTLRPRPEWDQLITARCVRRDCADMSASWGAFQIMGFNYKACGQSSVQDFVRTMESAEGQLRAFVYFLKNNPAVLKALRSKDWTAFAGLYNGPGFRKNNYDEKLRAAYVRNKSKNSHL